MTKEEQINLFLRTVSKEKILKTDDIYKQLGKLNLEDSYKDGHFHDAFFEKLRKKYFRNSSQVVYPKEMQDNSFLIMKKGEINDYSFKIYFHIKQEYLEKFSEQLFEFLKDSGMVHYTKIANSIRSDTINIRVNNESDVEAIKEFVSRNKFYALGAINSSPFIPESNVPGFGLINDVSKDYRKSGLLSYSYEVASIIETYLSNKRKIGDNSLPNIDDFNNFIKEIKNRVVPDRRIFLENIENAITQAKNETKIVNDQLEPTKEQVINLMLALYDTLSRFNPGETSIRWMVQAYQNENNPLVFTNREPLHARDAVVASIPYAQTPAVIKKTIEMYSKLITGQTNIIPKDENELLVLYEKLLNNSNPSDLLNLLNTYEDTKTNKY